MAMNKAINDRLKSYYGCVRTSELGPQHLLMAFHDHMRKFASDPIHCREGQVFSESEIAHAYQHFIAGHKSGMRRAEFIVDRLTRRQSNHLRAKARRP